VSFLLDTNVVSELRKGPRTHPNVVRWFSEIGDEALHLSVLVVGELRQGVERLRVRDKESARHLDCWLERLARGYAGSILPIDEPVAALWGRLNVPSPLPAVDGLLAATALVHDLTLVTRNGRHVTRTGVRVLNPFERRG
jgi:toxin FitB